MGFKCVYFNKLLGKYRGLVPLLKDHERAVLPDDLRHRTALTTDNHEEQEDAARAVDKWVSTVNGFWGLHHENGREAQGWMAQITP